LANEEEAVTIGHLQRLRSLVEGLAAIPTRRTLVLISDGFQLDPGREAFGLMAVYFPNVPQWQLRSSSSGIRNQFQAILQLAARRNVVIYTIDSRGLYGPGGIYDASSTTSIRTASDVQRATENAARESGGPLRQLATATGGIYLHNSNDLVRGLKRAFAEGREYYLLGYIPKAWNPDGKFRAIRVEVKGKGLQVRAKPGYWATE
jgi:VWFA-related protein